MFPKSTFHVCYHRNDSLTSTSSLSIGGFEQGVDFVKSVAVVAYTVSVEAAVIIQLRCPLYEPYYSIHLAIKCFWHLGFFSGKKNQSSFWLVQMGHTMIIL